MKQKIALGTDPNSTVASSFLSLVSLKVEIYSLELFKEWLCTYQTVDGDLPQTHSLCHFIYVLALKLWSSPISQVSNKFGESSWIKTTDLTEGLLVNTTESSAKDMDCYPNHKKPTKDLPTVLLQCHMKHFYSACFSWFLLFPFTFFVCLSVCVCVHVCVAGKNLS